MQPYLTRWQNTNAGTSGFLSGLNGMMTLLVTIALNMISILFIQVRMIAAIALLGGHSLKDDNVANNNSNMRVGVIYDLPEFSGLLGGFADIACDHQTDRVLAEGFAFSMSEAERERLTIAILIP